MSYPRNTRTWAIGDLVIHAADAKKPHMLMRVIGYSRDGQCKTVYAQPPHWMTHRNRQRVWRNDIEHLLDPTQFGIEPTTAPALVTDPGGVAPSGGVR